MGMFKAPKMPTPAPQAPAATDTDSGVDTAEQDAGRSAQRKKGLAASILDAGTGGNNPLRQPKKAAKAALSNVFKLPKLF